MNPLFLPLLTGILTFVAILLVTLVWVDVWRSKTRGITQEIVKNLGKWVLLSVLLGVLLYCGMWYYGEQKEREANNTADQTTPPPIQASSVVSQTPGSPSSSDRITREDVDDTKFGPSAEQNVRLLASRTGETEETIRSQTWMAAKMLRDKGIYQSKESILDGMLDIYPRSTTGMEYAECLALYTTERKRGKSHSEAILNIKSVIRELGIR